jgi:aspartate aminotransferase
MSESETLAMSQRSKELQSKGVDVINLSVGEPDFNTPEHIKAAAKKAIDDNFSHYAPVPGFPELRKAIAERLNRKFNVNYDMNNIIVSGGGKHSLANVLMSIIGPGDEVIIPAPFWVSYLELVKLAEGKSVVVEAGIEQDFKITPSQLEAAITPKTKAILMNSPSNPTGSMYSKQEMEALAVVLRKHPQVQIISDEIYEMIAYDQVHVSWCEIDGLFDRVIIVNGCSKGYAMTGWRIGYVAASAELVKACNKLQGQFTSATCSIALMAALAAMTGGDEPSLEMTRAFHKRRDLVLSLAKEIPGLKLNVPRGAFYIFPDIRSYFGKSFNGKVISNSSELAMYLLDEGHIATVAGSAFGAEGHIRLSYAASDDKLVEAMRRLKVALGNLK